MTAVTARFVFDRTDVSTVEFFALSTDARKVVRCVLFLTQGRCHCSVVCLVYTECWSSGTGPTNERQLGACSLTTRTARWCRRLRHRDLGDATDTFGRVRKIDIWYVKK